MSNPQVSLSPAPPLGNPAQGPSRSIGAVKALLASIALATVATLVSPLAWSASSQCPENYFRGQRPDFVNPRLTQSATELCSAGYAVWYSGIARAPIYAAEYLTKGRLIEGKGLVRQNDFRADTRVPSDWRAVLDDFRGSGYDRGHMAPSADMVNPSSDSASFLLSNMVAQDPKLNRTLWSAIEAGVRAQAYYSPVYVVTGPLFIGPKVDRLNGRVLIPTYIYKLVYDPARNLAAAYVVQNAPDKRADEVSLAQLEGMAGIHFFPAAQDVGMLKLPKPRWR